MPELDLGNVKGPQGKSAYQSALDAGYSGSEEAFNTAMAKAPDAVLYTPQSLTDDQKSQARGNIGAAPDGYGLGGVAKELSAADDLNNIRVTGWYDWSYNSHPQNAPDNNWRRYGCTMHVFATSPGGYAIQTVYDLSDDITHGCAIQRTICPTSSGNIYYPWGWVNPPMQIGVEYRTTERYLGKPVYCKLIDCGAVPDANTNKTVDFDSLGISRIIAWTGNVDVGGNTFALPYREIGREGGNATIYVFVNYTGITLRTDSRWFAENSGTAQCTIWYTKSTD